MAKSKSQNGASGDQVTELRTHPGGTFTILRVSDLTPSPTNPRKSFPEAELLELSRSIAANGLISPITVRPIADGYEIVAGNRRYRAALMASILELPAIVKDLTDEQVLEIQIEENLHRQDVPPLEEAEAFANLLESKRLTVDELAGRLNKSKAYVYRRLKLNTLHEVYRPYVQDGSLSTASAEVISAYPTETQRSLFKKIQYSSGDRIIWQPTHQIKERFKWDATNTLNKAFWPLDRPNLQPGLPACDTCEKNTAVASLLFPDEAAEPRCTDRNCWKIKETVWKGLAIQEWEAHCVATGATPYFMDLNYYEENDKKTVEKLLGRSPELLKWREYDDAEPGDEGAIEVMFVGAASWSGSEKNFTRGWVVPTTTKGANQGRFSGDWRMREIDEMEIDESEKELLRQELIEKRRLDALAQAEERQMQQWKLKIIEAGAAEIKDKNISNNIVMEIMRLHVRNYFEGYHTRNIWIDYFWQQARDWKPKSFAAYINKQAHGKENDQAWNKGVVKVWEEEVLTKKKRKGDWEDMSDQAWTKMITPEERCGWLDGIMLTMDYDQLYHLFATIVLRKVYSTIQGGHRAEAAFDFVHRFGLVAGIDTHALKPELVIGKTDDEEEEDYEDDPDYDYYSDEDEEDEVMPDEEFSGEE